LLERQTHRSGKDQVNHPRAGREDHANAVCGALHLVGAVKPSYEPTLVAPFVICKQGIIGHDDYDATGPGWHTSADWGPVGEGPAAVMGDAMSEQISDVAAAEKTLAAFETETVGASTEPTSMALTCRWRSRPQHQSVVFQKSSANVRFTPKSGR